MKAILGIDPGLEGGLAIRWPNEVLLELMPIADGELDTQKLAQWINAYREEIELVIIEKAIIQRFQRPQDCAKQWRMLGAIETVVRMLGMRVHLVRPDIWSAEFEHGVIEKDKHKRYAAVKKARKLIVGELFPGVDVRATARSTTRHEGMTDALLIAEWGRRKRIQGDL